MWTHIYVCLYTVGTKPKLLTPLEDMKVTAPKMATLRCDILAGDPAPRIHWYKNNKEIYASRKYSMKYEDSTATLTITDTNMTDNATYTCEADNKVGRVDTQADLLVQVAPKLSKDRKFADIVKVKEGSMFILQVNTVGSPTPSCVWTLNGQRVDTLPNVTVDTTADSSTLTVKSSTAKNDGKYEVQLQNEVGTDTTDFNIQVTGEMSLDLCVTWWTMTNEFIIV